MFFSLGKAQLLEMLRGVKRVLCLLRALGLSFHIEMLSRTGVLAGQGPSPLRALSGPVMHGMAFLLEPLCLELAVGPL